MTQPGSEVLLDRVQIVNPEASSSVVLVCEHAAFFIPASFHNLGLSKEDSKSHATWDPGAMAVARRLSEKLDAALIAGAVSRLVYDCNRPPESEDAMPARSEVIDVPGNVDISAAERAERKRAYYDPFCIAVADQVANTNKPVIVTIHSFTPVYHGEARAVEIGVLHDIDVRFADAMLRISARHTAANVQRNQPYGPEHGVTHTLKEHAIPNKHLNVMLELRNDLIRTEAQQSAMADMIAIWLADAWSQKHAKGAVQCVA